MYYRVCKVETGDFGDDDHDDNFDYVSVVTAFGAAIEQPVDEFMIALPHRCVRVGDRIRMTFDVVGEESTSGRKE